MDKISSVEEIGLRIAEIRNLRKGFITNFYFDLSKHALWIEKGVFFSLREGNTVFFIKRSDTFCNVFYNSTDLMELRNSIRKLMECSCCDKLFFDVVGNAEQSEAVSIVFRELGFYNYCSLVRMSKITCPVENAPSGLIEYATEEHAKEIKKLLDEYFDPQTEQIPFLEEIEEYSRLNHILCCSKDGKIIGFVIFERNRTTHYLRYWFVHPEYRDLKVGGTLLKYFFYEGRDTKRQLFWVIRTNEKAIKRYKHYGFAEENMFDYVYTNKQIEYERKNS